MEIKKDEQNKVCQQIKLRSVKKNTFEAGFDYSIKTRYE